MLSFGGQIWDWQRSNRSRIGCLQHAGFEARIGQKGEPVSDRVSVILPTYNRADLISDTLDSLLKQTRPIDEILVLDDGSTDATAQRVAAFGDKVRYHRKENGGKAAALNLALTMIEGNCVWICDDDDLILPDACEQLMQALESDPQLDFCAGLHEDFFIDPKTGEITRKAPGYSKASRPDEIFSDALDGCHIFQPGLIVRKPIYDQVGPFDESLTRSQDYQMLLRLTRQGVGRVLPQTVFLHREHQGTRGSAKERFSIEESNKKWIKYHRQIIKPLLAGLSDDELVPARIWNDPAHAATRHRSAMIRKGSVFGRHVLWDEALEAWGAIDPALGDTLTDYEIQLIRISTSYGLGCAPLLESAEIKQKVQKLKAASPLGRQVVRQLGRSMYWRIKAALKEGNVRDLLQVGKFILASR